ncbi:MAG: hypothetical protein J0L99_07985 [Chitinophagales bacterium]|nr:hypothetical protein [Chitinophagales bacterium]
MKKHFLFFSLVLVTSLLNAQSPLNDCPPRNPKIISTRDHGVITFNPPRGDENTRDKPEFRSDRLIFWVHGLGGNVGSWERAATATQYQQPGQQIPGYPARKATSLLPTYNEFSLSGGAVGLHNALASMGDPHCTIHKIEDKTINFIISHSQGGLVSRATDQMYDVQNYGSQRRFGGIVTFGTSHGGAQLLNNKHEFEFMANWGCNALIAGPKEDLLNNWIVGLFLPNDVVETFKDKMCKFISTDVLSMFFKEQMAPITEDYKVGAAALASLNSHSSSIPRVAFYGEEQEPVFYRLMYSLNKKTPNEFLPFQADPDQEMVDTIESVTQRYKAKYELYKWRVEYLESIGMPCDPIEWAMNPTCAIWDAEYWKKVKKRDAWQQGYDWLRMSNIMFKSITGARVYQPITETVTVCDCGPSEFPVGTPGECPPGCTTQVTTQTYFASLDKPNDGVVLAESATAYPGARNAALPKSNHQQMRNDSNTKQRLNEVFEGGFGRYFITDPR